jgi:hypothetical protein
MNQKAGDNLLDVADSVRERERAHIKGLPCSCLTQYATGLQHIQKNKKKQ